MLAVFSKDVAPFPKLDQLQNLYPYNSTSAMKNGLAKQYTSIIPNSFLIDLQPCCMLSTTVDQKCAFIPSFFQAKDDIFCILRGRIENIPDLGKFRLNVKSDQPTIFIEAYRSQRRSHDGPETEDQKTQREFYWLSFIREVKGKFVVVLFDNLKKTIFAATDRDAHLPLFWGIDVEGNLVLTTDFELAQLGCHKAYGNFPKGCYVSTADGLKTFDDQTKELYIEETVDSEGKFNMTVMIDGTSSVGSTSTAGD